MFRLNLVTPEKKILTDAEVDEIIVPGFRGELNILPNHSPLMTTLGTGILRYKLKGSQDFEKVVLSWGYCEVHPQGIFILAETAEVLEEIDRVRAEAALKKAQKQLIEPDLEPDQINKFRRKMERAQLRIDATNQHK